MLRMGDYELLKQIKEQLEKEDYHPNFGYRSPADGIEKISMRFMWIGAKE